jgi:hypothetical protein
MTTGHDRQLSVNVFRDILLSKARSDEQTTANIMNRLNNNLPFKSISGSKPAVAKKAKKVKMGNGIRDRFKARVTKMTRTAINSKDKIGSIISSVVDIEELDDALNQVQQLISITEPLTAKPRSPVALVKVMIGLGRFCISNPDAGDAEDYFRYEDRDWEEAFSGELAHIVFEAIRPRGQLVRASGKAPAGGYGPPPKEGETSPAGAYIGTCSVLGGLQLGWMLSTFDRVTAIFLPEAEMVADGQKRVLQAASDAFWSRRKTKHLVYRVTKKIGESVPGLVDDAARNVYRSKLSDDLVENARQYIEAGVSWTYMLYGPPGSGKSTATQRLIMDLDIRSLRLPVETLHELGADDLNMIFNIVRPEAVVIDDFDRCREQSALLERLETMRKEVKLVVATVNDPDDLEEAILRPGRIDEWIEVDRLDDDAIRNILGEFADDSLELVKTWPVAFIENYITRRRARKMTAEQAKSSLVELAARVKRMRRKHTSPLSFDDQLNILVKDDVDAVPSGRPIKLPPAELATYQSDEGNDDDDDWMNDDE